MTAQELLERYTYGERDFSSASLPNVDLNIINLDDINLRYANLKGANLSRAHLINANLRGANLQNANLFYAVLCKADLYGAVLTGANLRYTDLQSADLQTADLRSADLLNVYLTDANLTDADLRNTRYPPTTSHEFVSEALRRAAGGNVRHRMIAGLVHLSTDWCWEDMQNYLLPELTPDECTWIVRTLTANEHWWEAYASRLRYSGFMGKAGTLFETDETDKQE